MFIDSHKGSVLPIKTCQPIDFKNTTFLAHYDIIVDESLRGIKPLDGSVYTLRENGGKYGGCVAIEEGTENGFTHPDFSSYNGYTGFTFTTTNEPESYTGKALVFEYPSGSFNDAGRVDMNLRSGYTTGLMTISYYAKGIGNSIGKKPKFWSGISWYVFDKPLTSRYQRYSMTVEFGEGSGGACISGVEGAVSGDVVYIHSPQLEKKSFATSFVDGSRTKGKLWYPKQSFSESSFTVSMWFNIPRVYTESTNNNGIQGSWYHPIFEVCPTEKDTTGDVGFSVVVSPADNYSTKRKIHLRSPRGSYGTTSILDNTWYHLTVSFDGSTYKVYIDGNLEMSNGGSPPTITQDSVIMVGGGYYGASNVLIDELRIDSVARTQEEIEVWYGSGAPFFPKGIHKKYL